LCGCKFYSSYSESWDTSHSEEVDHMLDRRNFSPCKIRDFYLRYHFCIKGTEEALLLQMCVIVIGISGGTRYKVYFEPQILQYL
jgi:hypothetical protein